VNTEEEKKIVQGGRHPTNERPERMPDAFYFLFWDAIGSWLTVLGVNLLAGNE
jgi:hypothetical protein